MYIHPFVAGIMFTILVELVLTIALVFALSKPKNEEEKNDENTDYTN